MPKQKTISIHTDHPDEITRLFLLGEALAQDAWGVTLRVNQQVGIMTTNAPMNIIDFHTERLGSALV